MGPACPIVILYSKDSLVNADFYLWYYTDDDDCGVTDNCQDNYTNLNIRS